MAAVLGKPLPYQAITLIIDMLIIIKQDSISKVLYLSYNFIQL